LLATVAASYLRPEAAPLDEDAPTTVLAWAERHRRIDGRPFDLARYRPLEQLYLDSHPHKVIIKPAQRGVSEYAINLAMFALDVGARAWATGKEGLNVGYLFPTKQAVGDFSKERVAGMKDESPTLRAIFAGYDDVTFKKVRQSYLYMRGAQSENDLHGFAADVLIRDEYDRMGERARALAEKRLNASELGLMVDLSTPTVPATGIDAAFATSDQHVWEVRCGSCEGWAELPFFTTVRLDGEPHDAWKEWDQARVTAATPTVHCPRCEAELDHCGPGRWVAQRPGGATRGYRVPWYGFPFTRIGAICRSLVSADPTTVTEAHRSDLGYAYVPRGARVDAEMVARLAVDAHGPYYDVTMGVDVGAVLHYRLSGRGPGGREVFDAGHVREWDELSDLLVRYGVRRCVIDAHPELHKCKEWQARHSGIVLRALYPSEKALDGRLYREKGDDGDEGIVQINRTMAADALYAAISRGAEHPQGERWARPLVHDAEVRSHITAPVRVLVTDDRGQQRAAWTHAGPDHLFHASIYDRIALATLPSDGVFF
jgi:hypothetical protein